MQHKRHQWKLSYADYYEARYYCTQCPCIKDVKNMYVGEKRPKIRYTLAERISDKAPECQTVTHAFS